jgi:beta-phosphoglucomutase-like phosphatase (HAD superfamily)
LIVDNLKAIILDMDGVLVDTEPLHIESFNVYMNMFNISYPPNLAESFIGYSIEDNVKRINENFLAGREVPVDEGVNIRDGFFVDLLQKKCRKPMMGIDDIILFAQTYKIKLSLASSSIREHINIILDNLTRYSGENTDYRSIFETITGGDDVKNKKPAPDIYELTLKKINLPPENCMAVEDSYAGIMSARAAGIKVIGLDNPFIDKNNLAHADYIIGSLMELPDLLSGK